MIRYAPTPKTRRIPQVGPKPGQGEGARFRTRPSGSFPPSVIAAGNRALAGGPAAIARYNRNIPKPGARNQTLLGEVTAAARRRGTPTDARPQADPIAGAKGLSYLQVDPEGGLRKVNVYNVNGRRVARVVQNPKNVDEAVVARLKTRAGGAPSPRRAIYEKAVRRG